MNRLEEIEANLGKGLDLTNRILFELAKETVDFEQVSTWMENRSQALKALQQTADNEEGKKALAGSDSWQELLAKDEMMRYLIQRLQEHVSEQLFNSRNEEQSEKAYHQSRKKELFITGKLEG